MHSKEKIAAAISRARGDLEQALTELQKVPAFDPGTIAYHVHALGNYLSILRATTELLEFSLQDQGNPQIQRWLESLEHAIQLMTHRVNQLGQGPAGSEPKPRFEEVDLDLLLQRGTAFYQRIAEKKGIQIYYTHPSTSAQAWTDRVIISAVLDNILSNAVKYTPHGGQIFVTVGRSEDRIVGSVRDEGPGLSKEDQAKLFGRGVTLSPVPTGNESSSGYGLAIAKEMIEKAGGSIWCSSVKGKGSTFFFAVPEFQEGRGSPTERHPE
jgi:signal transduction histidine kinase